ncbi:MAG: hypothetical protein COZ18_00160 [Flexibacter sp. CG_4_10_14_3_um_filter_32_15]|nr:MAG: hypothetical protein COZ18_00160 [Flexibacter sp. CG_4_10_14_3_um_filter_32_15]
MKSNNKKTIQSRKSNLQNYSSLLFVLAFLFFFQINSAKAQNAIQSSETTTTEELDWNVDTTEKTELTQEEKELAQQTEAGWENWDAEHPSETSVIIYDDEETKETNKVKSPTEILMSALVGNWEGFYGGSKAYINFKANKTVVINTSMFSNIPSASGREHTQLYYEIDASKSPYRLIFYNRDKEIKGIFRINDNNQITICHNFKNDEQPQNIDNKYTVINFSKIETEKEK